MSMSATSSSSPLWMRDGPDAVLIYAASEGLQTVVLEETVSGGQAGSSPMIRNYQASRTASAGMNSPAEPASRPGCSVRTWCFSQPTAGLTSRAADASCTSPMAARSRPFRGIVAPGIAWRRLGVPRLEALIGSGVFYGAAGVNASDGGPRRLRRGSRQFEAGRSALFLAWYARQVTMLVRGDSLARSMSDYLTREVEVASASPCACRPRSPTATGSILRSCYPARPCRGLAGPGGHAVRADRRRAAGPNGYEAIQLGAAVTS